MNLLHAGVKIPPDDTAWKRQIYGGIVHATRMQEEAGRLWQRLIPEIDDLQLVKGPALAQLAWPTMELREYDDLDFRCNRRDYPALCRGLEQAGYRPQHADPRRNANLWHYGWGVAFFHPDGFMVEANHRLFPPSSPCPAKAFSAAQQVLPSQHASIGDMSIRIPTPAAHLQLACIHALWHGGERLAWLVDIAGLLVRHPDSAHEAMQMASRHRFARTALHTGIAIADALFGPGLVEGQETALGDLANANRIKAAQEAYLNQLYSGIPATFREKLAFQRTLLSLPKRVMNAANVMMVPGDNDFQAWPLPRRLRPLYWLYRPLRGAMQRLSTKAVSPAHASGSHLLL